MPDRSRKVVLLIDYDNLQICASRDTPGRDLQLEPVVQLAQKYGTVMHARAYAEWNLSTERLAVYKLGVEPAFAPVLRTEGDRSGKSLADTVMVAEGMDILWTLAPDVLVLATSDKDLIPLVRVAKQRGAHVVVVGSDFTAIPLREMADEHVSYKQVITEASTHLASFVPGRTPPTPAEPVRLARGTQRERDRTPREPRQPAQPRSALEPTAPAPTPAAPPPATLSTPPSESAGGGLSSEADLPPGARRRRRRTRRRPDRMGAESENEGAAEQTFAGEFGADEPELTDAAERDDVPSPVVWGQAPEPSPAETATPFGQPLAEPSAFDEHGLVPSTNGALPSTDEEEPVRAPARPRTRRTAATPRRRSTPPAE